MRQMGLNVTRSRKVSTFMTTQFVLDAPEQAIWQRKPSGNKALIHHSDRGSQYLSIRYTERLAQADIDASVGTVGDVRPGNTAILSWNFPRMIS